MSDIEQAEKIAAALKPLAGEDGVRVDRVKFKEGSGFWVSFVGPSNRLVSKVSLIPRKDGSYRIKAEVVDWIELKIKEAGINLDKPAKAEPTEAEEGPIEPEPIDKPRIKVWVD